MDHDRLAIEFAKLKDRVEPMLAEYEEHKAREAERDAKYAAHEATKAEAARREPTTSWSTVLPDTDQPAQADG